MTKSSAKVTDIAQKLMSDQEDGQQYESVCLCVGTNDCQSAETNIYSVAATYKEMVLSLTDKVPSPSKVIISSIPPRKDDTGRQSRVSALNAALITVANDTGATYVDNDQTFKLADGQINDGYLQNDGLHLSKNGTNSLFRNLKLTVKTEHSTVVTRSQRQNQYWPNANRNRNYYQQRTPRPSKTTAQSNDRGCYNCGELNHISSNCRHGSRIRCHTCQKLGHKSKYCYNDQY